MTLAAPVKKIVTPEEAAAELLNRKRARGTLHEFVRQSWHVIEGGRQLRDGWALGAVCEHTQAWVVGEIRDLLINIPPRMTKSTTCSVCLGPWAWIDHPEVQFMYLSYSDKLSMRDHRKSRQLIESQWYQARWGESYALAHDQNTKVRYDNSKGGYRVQTSLTGTVTGEGADRIVLDDPNSMSDLSEAGLATVESFWTDVMPTRLNDARTGGTLIVQQRGHERDLSGTVLKEGGFVHLRLPMEYEPEKPCITVKLPSTLGKKWRDPRIDKGELLWPERIGAEELAQIKKRLGSQYNISGQLQQRPSPGEGGIIKRKWFQIWENAKPPKLDMIMLSIDTAVSEKKDAAYSAITAWGVFRQPVRAGGQWSRLTNTVDTTPESGGGQWSNMSDPTAPIAEVMVPNVILLNIWRDRCEYTELRKRIKRMSDHYLDDGPLTEPPMKPAKAMKPDMVLIESKSSGISLIQELRKIGVLAIPFNPDKLGDKTMRVRLVTPILEGGRVWLPGKPPDFKLPRKFAAEFLEDAISFPKAAARDVVDTMTQALWRLHSTGWISTPDDEAREEKPTHGTGSGAEEAFY